MTYPRTLSGTLGHASIMLRHNRHQNQNRCYVSFQIHEQGQNSRQTEYVPISQHTTQRTVLKTRNREGSVSSANRPYLRCKLGQPGAIQMSSQNNHGKWRNDIRQGLMEQNGRYLHESLKERAGSPNTSGIKHCTGCTGYTGDIEPLHIDVEPN